MSTEHLLGDIGTILHALTDAANEPRQEAEKQLRTLSVQSPGEVLLLLAQIGAQAVGGFQLEQRLLALILLRRLSFSPLPGLFLNDSHHHASDPFDVIAERVRGRIETVLSAGLKDEMDPKMRKGLGTCAGGWASSSATRQRPCLSFPPVLLELTSSPHPSHRLTPFQLLDIAPTLLIDSVREPLPITQLASLLLAGINDPSIDVRVEALKAMRSVILEGVTGKERGEIGPALILEAYKSISNMPIDSVKFALDPLVELASVHAGIFAQSLPFFVPYLMSLISPPASSSNSYNFSPYPASTLAYEEYELIATAATEIVLCLSELKREEMLAWEGGKVGHEMIGLLYGCLTAGLQEQSEDGQDWMDETDIEEVDDSYPVYAEEAIDRLSISFGGEVLLPALALHAQDLMTQSDWRCRYAAMAGLAASADGCSGAIIARLQDVLNLISPAAKDPHPRVRYGFLQCMGQMCGSLEESIQTQYPQEILTMLVNMLRDPVARVRAHAGACIVSFFECDIPVVTAMLRPLVRCSVTAFQAGPIYAQEQMLATLASVATHAGEAFIPYYRETFELCHSVLLLDHQDSLRKLVGRALECGTMTGLAVGKATFGLDAVKLAWLMIIIQNNIGPYATGDPRSPFMIDAWACLCRSLGSDFEPFMPHVIPPLLRAASYRPTKTGHSNDLTGADEEEVDADIAGVRSGELDEKILAFDNLAVYAYTMREFFAPYLQPCMELSLDALGFMHSEDVREAAAFLIPALLQVAKDSKAWEQSSEPLHQVFQTMVNAMAKETSYGYLALLYKSFTDSLHVIALSLPHPLMSHFLKISKATIDELQGTRQDRLHQEAYMDEADLDIYGDEELDEDTALDHMVKAFGMCGKYDENPEVRQALEELRGRVGVVKGLKLGAGKG